MLYEKNYVSQGTGFWEEQVSYDFGVEGAYTEGALNLNITFNMHDFLEEFLEVELNAPHWRDPIKETGMDALEGKKGFEAIPIIQNFFIKCNNYRDNLSADYDSPNGWGTVESCMIKMGLLMAECIINPYNEIWVHR